MLRKLKDVAALLKIAGYLDKLRKESKTMKGKNILLSKTFWANIAGLAITIGGILPAEYAVPVMAVGNIILRIVTNEPVNVFPK